MIKRRERDISCWRTLAICAKRIEGLGSEFHFRGVEWSYLVEFSSDLRGSIVVGKGSQFWFESWLSVMFQAVLTADFLVLVWRERREKGQRRNSVQARCIFACSRERGC